jgi:excinuclease UvrABC nuclease subunit
MTARKLLQGFGSVQAVRAASAADLEASVGPALARRIVAWREAAT